VFTSLAKTVIKDCIALKFQVTNAGQIGLIKNKKFGEFALCACGPPGTVQNIQKSLLVRGIEEKAERPKQ